MVRALILFFLMAMLPGCYYMQAASGQWEVMRKREPLNDVVNDPDTPPELAQRLQLMLEAREYSVSELGLPDNDSYRSYTDLARDYVVWNVFATPEFSLEPKTWCFPVAGCVGYRGYFSEDGALKKAAQLADDGYDVAVGGIAAYSTLGRFNDPILNTMMRWDDIDLVATLFHELAHQVVYVKDDTAFNESFATALEEIGIERWVEARQQQAQLAAYRDRQTFRVRLTELMSLARTDLQQIYDSGESEESMRRQKQQRLERLATELKEEFSRSGRRPSPWYSGALNNAHLMSTSLYHGMVPSFRRVFERCERRLDCFYARVRALAELDKDRRDEALTSSDPLGL